MMLNITKNTNMLRAPNYTGTKGVENNYKINKKH